MSAIALAVLAASAIVAATPPHAASPAVVPVPCEHDPNCFTPLPLARRIRCRQAIAATGGGPCECFMRCAGHARMLRRLRPHGFVPMADTSHVPDVTHPVRSTPGPAVSG